MGVGKEVDGRTLLKTWIRPSYLICIARCVIECGVCSVMWGWRVVGWLVEFYVLTTSKIISGGETTCDSAHSWQYYSTASQINQASNSMTRCLTHSKCTDTELTSLCHILVGPNRKSGSDKFQYSKSMVWPHRWTKFPMSSQEACTLPIFPPLPVWGGVARWSWRYIALTSLSYGFGVMIVCRARLLWG